MRANAIAGICGVMTVLMIGASSAWANKKGAPQPQVELTEAGKKLEVRYSEKLNKLKAEIVAALPKLDEKKAFAYTKSRDAEKVAELNLKDKQNDLSKNRGTEGLLNHRKGWIEKAGKAVEEAKDKLKQAESAGGSKDEKEAAVKAVQEALAKSQADYDTASVELKKAEEGVVQAKKEEPELVKAVEAAQKGYELARAATIQAIKDLGMVALLSDGKLDAKLAEYVVLSEAGPSRLAEFVQQGKAHEGLVEKLLADSGLMLQMVVADGAADGRYGQAMKIYADIQKASSKSKEGVLQKLAVAISLEHAVPVSQRNAADKADAPATVDPLKRYLHFEKAFLAGELDAGFKDLSVWDYRMVVDGEEPDEILAWGREMLRNYRPDHIYTADYKWRYVASVKTDVKYGSADGKFDQPHLQFYQNILMNGGVCGRRAFFGRFILRAFGVPTTARPQKGHAALAHWTPDGWVVCLGAGWGHGWTKTRYDKDLDFLASTQARENEKRFMEVKRGQWIGDVFGEARVYGFVSGDPGFWYGISLYQQSDIIDEAKAVVLAAVGEDIGEANESKEKEAVKEAVIADEDRNIVVSKGGVITIPAVACSNPKNSTEKIVFMKSYLGGMQLHYNRNAKPETFEYTFDAPAAGKYKLTARVVTPSWKQALMVAVNGSDKAVEIELPFTVGMWDVTEPVEISLVKGQNVLAFSRPDDGGVKGLTIKDFTLMPAAK